MQQLTRHAHTTGTAKFFLPNSNCCVAHLGQLAADNLEEPKGDCCPFPQNSESLGKRKSNGIERQILVL